MSSSVCSSPFSCRPQVQFIMHDNELRDYPFEPGGATRALRRPRSHCAGRCGRSVAGPGFGLVRRWAVRKPSSRRLDAACGVAGRTERVLIGPACMGSFALRNPLVFAYEWASLDVLSNGRTRLVVCAGGGAGPLWEAEGAAIGI